MKKRPYRRVVAAVFNTVWCILPDKLKQITALLDLRSQGVRLSREQIRDRIGIPSTQPANANQGQVAVLNIYGTIAPRVSAMQDISGGVSAEAVSRAFDAAIANDNVSAIVLNIDSPGGAVGGIAELSQKIFAARGTKPIVAVASGDMASAAYWIGSAADRVVVAPSANNTGSIGALSVFEDDSRALEMEGIDRTAIGSSEFKAEGWGPMTDGLKAYLTDRVKAIGTQFEMDVARNRGVSLAKVQADYGRGRTYLAADAVKQGMADSIGTLESVLAELGVDAGSSLSATSAKSAQMKEQVMNFESWCRSIGQDPAKLTAAQKTQLRDLYAEIAAGTVVDVKAITQRVSAIVATETASTGDEIITRTAAPLQISADDIIAQVNLTSLSDSQKLTLIASLTKERATLTYASLLDKVNQAVVDGTKANAAGATVVAGLAEQDKFRTQARDAILARTWIQNRPSQIFDVQSQEMVAWNPQGRDFQLRSLPRLAEQCIIMAGVPQEVVRRLAPADIARIVLGADLRQFGIMASGGAYNVTGMFSNIFYDASHVILRRSYMEAKTTFQLWMKQGESLTDFKPVHKVIAGELSDPKAIPEDGEFEETSTTDGRESYKLTVWGEVWSQTWQMIVGDVLGAFTDTQAKQGRAMRRKQNKLAYGVLKDNANLSDGGALFNATAITSAGGHANLTTGAGAPSVATLNTLTSKMMTQTGLNASDRTTLGLMPKWLPHPPAMRGTVLNLLQSTSDPASSNANSKNIWENELQPITEAELSLAAGGSDVAWYLGADFNDVDTIEYAYLQGLETPAFDQMVDFNRLALRQRMYQAFAVKALDFRGLQKHAGE
jgi:signal peptide peptidase SppA